MTTALRKAGGRALAGVSSTGFSAGDRESTVSTIAVMSDKKYYVTS